MAAFPDSIRKCVAFLQFTSRLTSSTKVAGTAFFVRVDVDGRLKSDQVSFHYLVTAKHCLENALDRGNGMLEVRINDRNGTILVRESRISEWRLHPDHSTDVAIIPFEIEPEMDVIPFKFSESCFEQSLQSEFSLGDEVAMAGLFYRHFGSKRNIPIVRLGTLAAFAEEPIDYRDGMNAYLVEIRSIGGFSGSPVFVHHAPFGLRGSKYLIGVMHGHFGIKDPAILDALDLARTNELNSGIGVVVPIDRVADLINAEDLQEFRRKQAAKIRQARANIRPDN